jgi:hypothetical protein
LANDLDRALRLAGASTPTMEEEPNGLDRALRLAQQVPVVPQGKPRSIAKDYFKMAPTSVARGAIATSADQMAGAAYGLKEWLAPMADQFVGDLTFDQKLNRAMGGPSISEQVAQSGADKLSTAAKFYRSKADQMKSPADWQGSFAEDVFTGAGSTLPFALTPGGLAGVAISGALASTGSAEQEADRLGFSPEMKREYINFSAAIGSTEALPFERFISASPIIKRLAGKRILAEMLTSAPEEATQEFLQTFSDKLFKLQAAEPRIDGALAFNGGGEEYMPPRSIGELTAEALSDPEVWRAAAAGGIVGGIFGAGAGAIEDRQDEQAPAPKAEKPASVPPVASPGAPRGPLDVQAEVIQETALDQPQRIAAVNPGGVVDWANHNQDVARELALKPGLSRSDMAKAGLGELRMPAADRQAFHGMLKEWWASRGLAGETQTEGGGPNEEGNQEGRQGRQGLLTAEPAATVEVSPPVVEQAPAETVAASGELAKRDRIVSESAEADAKRLREEFLRNKAVERDMGNYKVALTPTSKPGYVAQATRFDKNGEPFGDTMYKTLDEALNDFSRETYKRRADLPDTYDLAPDLQFRHIYAPRLRPPGPGAIPKDGLVEVREGGTHGIVVYSRALSEKELGEYELNPIGFEEVTAPVVKESLPTAEESSVVPPAAPTPTDKPSDLSALSGKELMARAKAAGVKGYVGKKREVVERMIRDAEAKAGQPAPKPLPPLDDNLPTDAKKFADRLYTETNFAKLISMVDVDTMDESGIEGRDGLFTANTPDMALGQGDNRGVLVELDPSGLMGRVSKAKPMWNMMYDQGMAEIVLRNNKQGQYRGAVRRFTIRPDAKRDVFAMRLMGPVGKRLLAAGWTKEKTDDGSIVWNHPEVSPRAQEATAGAESAGEEVIQATPSSTAAGGSEVAKSPVAEQPTLPPERQAKEILSEQAKAEDEPVGMAPISEGEFVALVGELDTAIAASKNRPREPKAFEYQDQELFKREKASYDAAIKSFPKHVRIQIPGDGTYTLNNEPKALREVKKLILKQKSGFTGTKLKFPGPNKKMDEFQARNPKADEGNTPGSYVELEYADSGRIAGKYQTVYWQSAGLVAKSYAEALVAKDPEKYRIVEGSEWPAPPKLEQPSPAPEPAPAPKKKRKPKTTAYDDITPPAQGSTNAFAAWAYRGDVETPPPAGTTYAEAQANGPSPIVWGMPEMVRLTKDLLGKVPQVRERLSKAALGRFRARGDQGSIQLKADIAIGPVIRAVSAKAADVGDVETEVTGEILDEFPDLTTDDIVVKRGRGPKPGTVSLTFYRKDPTFAAQVLAHEIGHMWDWLPDKTLARGNILGRIASLRKFLKTTLDELPTDNLDTESIDELRKKARLIGLNPEGKSKPDLITQLRAQAGKALTAEDRKKANRRAQKEAAAQFPDPEDRDNRNALRSQLYREYIQEMIEDRGIYDRDQVMEELKDLTQWWSPFDPAKASEEYLKYRYSSKELLAEAISVLLNNPVALEERAPTFFKAWNAYMSRKGDAAKLYEQIRQELFAGVADVELVKRTREGFRAGDAADLKNRQRYAMKAVDYVSKSLRMLFLDAHAEIAKRATKDRMAGRLAAEKDPQYAIEEAIYSGAEAELYLDRVGREVRAVLDGAGVDWETFDEYLLLRRVSTERATLFNPFGWTKYRALKRIAEMREQMGGRFDEMEKARKAFWKVRMDFVVKRVKESGIFTEALEKAIADNENYATFDIVPLLDQVFGQGNGVKIYRQIGTLADVTGPGTATIRRDLALLRGIAWNEAKRTTVDFMLQMYPEEIKETDRRWVNNHWEFRETTESGKATIMFLHKGQMYAYDVDDWIGAAFNRTDSRALRVAAAMARATGAPFRLVFTGISPGFWMFNVVRDYIRAIRNLPGANPVNFTKHYLKAFKPAVRSEFGIPEDVIKEMLGGRMLISVADIAGLTNEDTQIERLLNMYVKDEGKWNSSIVAPFRWAFHRMLKIGEVLERVPKIAGYTYLKQHFPEMDKRRAAHIIRHRVGSPSFITQGTGSPITNNLFLFSNAIIQAYRADIQAFREDPKRYAKHIAMYSLAPKVLMYALASGAIVSLLKGMGADDDDDTVRFFDRIKRMYQGVSKYDMINYNVIPLGIDSNGKTVYLRVPNDEINRFFGGVAYKAMESTAEGDLSGLPAIVDYTAGQLPSLNPAFTIAGATMEYLGGRNPYDEFRGDFVIPENLFKADTKETNIAFLKWVANTGGVGIVHRFNTGSPSEVRSELEKAVGFPVLSATLGRFVKVSDKGKADLLRDVINDEQKARARETEDVKAILAKKVKGEPLEEWEQLMLDANSDYADRREESERIIRFGDVYQRQLQFAKSRAERDAIQLKMLEIEEPNFDLMPYIERDVRTRVGELISETTTAEERAEIRRWMKERNVSRSAAMEAFQPEIDKLTTDKGRLEKKERVRDALRGL